VRSLVHTLKVLAGVEAPATQVTEAELRCLLSYAQGAAVIVEIGCYEGSTTAALAASTDGRVYSIDPFFSGRLGVCYGEWTAKFVRWRRKLKNIEFVKSFSHVVAPEFRHEVDFIFIDADHSYEAIKRDWQDWFPKVRQGGIIALHDCRVAQNSPDYLGSMKFYDSDIPEMAGLVEQVDAIDSLAVFKVKSRSDSSGNSDDTPGSSKGL
jgi:predicted O-methyltransferase YrrM